MAKSRQKRESEIRAVLSDLAKSGESVQVFAKRRGISAWTVYDWRRRFGDPERRTRSETGKTEFVAVEVRGESASPSFEIEVGKFVVRVRPGFDDSELLRLVGTLSSAC